MMSIQTIVLGAALFFACTLCEAFAPTAATKETRNAQFVLDQLPRFDHERYRIVQTTNKRHIEPTTQSGLTTTALSISSGFSFDDGDQVLVSVQKPLGIVLEQDGDGPIYVTELDPNGSAASAGVVSGDVLVAIQNADMTNKPLEEALAFIGRAPKVVNLRFLRKD